MRDRTPQAHTERPRAKRLVGTWLAWVAKTCRHVLHWARGAIILIAAAYHRHALSLSLSRYLSLAWRPPSQCASSPAHCQPLDARACEASNLEPCSRTIPVQLYSRRVVGPSGSPETTGEAPHAALTCPTPPTGPIELVCPRCSHRLDVAPAPSGSEQPPETARRRPVICSGHGDANHARARLVRDARLAG